MALTFDEGKKMLFDTIQQDLRHKDYDRTTEIAKMYTAFITGEDVDELLIQFAPRETDAQFTQRKALTELITPYIANRIMTPMYQVGRTLASKSFSWDKADKAEDKKKKLNDALKEFAGDESLEDFLTHAMVDLDSTDPNSFIVAEFEGEYDSKNPNSKIEPYPFVVSSKEAINYFRKNNKLQFLVVMLDWKLKRYTIYLKDDAIIANQIDKDDLEAYLANNPDAEILYKDEKMKEKGEIYIITRAEHKAGRIPAVCIGTKKDLKTNKRTFVPLIHPAKSFFKKSIKTISEFDLTNSLHVFPKLIQYDNVCPGDISNNMICQDGKTPDGSKCSVCHGSGFNEHHSSADVLRVKMPDDLSKVVSLENFIAYKHPGIDILEFMKKLGLYEFPDLATKAVYCSELYSADKIVTTATEKNIDLESVYNTLKPFANKWSNVYKHLVTCIGTYINLGSGLSVEHTFPKDFKMKTLAALLDDLTKANTSGAASYIKKEINRDIAQKLYADKPEELLIIEIKEKFYPFNGKTESEVNNIIMNNLVSQFNKILYANFDVIFDELAQENTTDTVSFYKMEMKKQRELLKNKVTEYMAAIDAEQASQRANDFGTVKDGAAGSDDSQDHEAGDSVTFGEQPVEIVSANPGPDGGTYKIKLGDGTEKDVKGIDLKAVVVV